MIEILLEVYRLGCMVCVLTELILLLMVSACTCEAHGGTGCVYQQGLSLYSTRHVCVLADCGCVLIKCAVICVCQLCVVL